MTRNLRFADDEPSTLPQRKAQLRAYMKGQRAENTNRDIKEQRLIEHFYEAVFPKTFIQRAHSCICLRDEQT